MATTVIDELVVRLRLDTSEYDKALGRLDGKVVTAGKKADTTTKSVKGLALGIAGLARQIALLMGAGSVGGIVSMLASLTTMETSLRRSAVSTGMSNREMKAWGSTARRLGADAQAGAQAVADLAREQRQFNVTGQGPTMQALARMGVRIGPDTNLVEALSQAQQIFRSAPAGQQGQIEAALAAQGVSSDLILMIKSEQDARAMFTRSFAESAEENRQAMDALADTFESLKNAARNFVMVLATALQPHAEAFSAWLRDFSADSTAVKNVTTALVGTLKLLANAVILASEGFNRLNSWLELIQVATRGGVRLAPEQLARVRTPAERAALAAMDAEFRRPGGGTAPTPAGAALSTPRGAMGYLISQHGLTVDQAAAMVSNFMGESGMNPAAFNPAGGGQGAFGIGQWRGARLAALRARFGNSPTIQQQLDFAMTDPEERRRMGQAFSAGGNLGASVSRIYEAHGNVAEDARRGAAASRLAGEYIGQQVNVQTMNVTADNPQQLGQQLQRQSGVQNYAAGVR